MQFYEAKVIDILRSHQRDQEFTAELQTVFLDLLKLFGPRNYNRFIKYVPLIAESWYYLITSVSNIQTLGEEYAGILRFDGQRIPSRMLQFLWLVLFVFGDSIYDRLLNKLKSQIKQSTTIVDDAKTVLIKYVEFFQEKKLIIKRLHQSLFYIMGVYYSLSNRITGIKYVLLRDWMQDDSATKSFRLLGNVTLLYIIFHLGLEFFSRKETKQDDVVYDNKLAKGCILCGENRKNTSATLCGHLFCWECIHDSLKYQNNCPVCREVIDPSRIILLQNFI